MSLKIYEDSKNYTAQVIKLPTKQVVVGLDNLVEVNVLGNSCLIGKDSPENEGAMEEFYVPQCGLNMMEIHILMTVFIMNYQLN